MFDFIRPGKSKASAQGLSIIIVGCGKVGRALLEQLSRENHDITIIDKNERKVRELGEMYDVMGVTGNGASYVVQKEAGVDKADVMIAVTDSDELNLLCCTIAKYSGKCSAIARIRTPDYSRESEFLRERLGLAMIINPELEAAKEAARILYLPSALEVNSFAHGQAELIKFKIKKDNILAGKTISYLRQNIESNILVCGIQRGDDLIIPTGDTTMMAEDVISIVADRNATRGFFEKIGFKTNSVKSCLIVGGGKSAYYLAEELLRMNIDVKIIERNARRCEELSILLPKAIIIHGDAADEDLLKEEGIEYVESFVPLTGIDEENIFLTLYSGQVSNAKCITKISHIHFKDVINSLNLGSVIYPKYFTSEAIIKYVRAMKNSMKSNSIETLYHMFDRRVEALEFRVDQPCRVTDIPIMDLKLKDKLLICFINRGGRILLPTGSDQIMVGDTVMVVTTHSGFIEIEDILA
ncbi:MAG: Trk system potassium transporter TrkA [Eubacterium sp.]|nr:Trk system potassium transporter TrkA [Eubacterium sp.]